MRSTLVVVVSAAFVAGCAGMAGGDSSGQGAGQGYGYGSQRTVGEVVDDATITAQIKAKLAADPDLSALKINVDTNQGAVRLKGEVKTLALRRKADQLAQGIKGVKSVDNQLIITG
jgi:hyperosmotically inducible periplasmic protein